VAERGRDGGGRRRSRGLRRPETLQRPAAATNEQIEEEPKENFRSKHELRRVVDALDLNSDTMLGISNLVFLRGQMPHI
jgi:hypothetical protein